MLRVLLVLALSFAFACATSLALDAGTDAQPRVEKKTESKKIPYPPEVETKFAEFLKKVKEAKGKVWIARMKKEIEEIAKATGLNPEGVTALEAASKAPVESSLNLWIDKLEELFRKEMPRASAQLLPMFDQITAQIDLYANEEFGIGESEPEDEAAWTEAVKRTLTADQSAVWEKILTDRKQKRDKETDEYLKPMMAGIKEAYARTILAKSAEIARTLALSKERTDALNAVAKSAADKSTEEWQKRVGKILAVMKDEQRKQLRAGRMSFGAAPGEAPEQQAIWKDGLAKILTSPELQQLETAKTEHRTRHVRALSRIMLVELDQKVAFTQSQRERLLPVAERLISESGFFQNEQPEEYGFNFEAQTFFSAGTNAPEKEMTAILDSAQWQHWKEACDPKNIEENMQGRNVRSPAPANNQKPSSTAPEPEEFELAISDFLQEKTGSARKRMLATMTLSAEDAARLASLGPESVHRLLVAARGATEDSMASWKTNVDQAVRGQMGEIGAINAKQRLLNIQDYMFERVPDTAPEKQPVWDKTVQTELNADQRAKWKKEVDGREAFKSKSIASLILAEFDRKTPISVEQWDKLEPIIAAIAIEYAPEIGNYFSNGNMNRWYLQNYTMFIPMAGVPEKDMKAILSKEQLDHWKGTNECANGTNYWTNIQQMHAQRVKEKK